MTISDPHTEYEVEVTADPKATSEARRSAEGTERAHRRRPEEPKRRSHGAERSEGLKCVADTSFIPPDKPNLSFPLFAVGIAVS